MPSVFKTNKDLFFKCQSESLKMASEPTKSMGFEVVLTRNVSCYKAGQKGIVRPFDACQIENKIKEYNDNILYGSSRYKHPLKFNLPDLNQVYDFHPYYVHNGKKQISIWHAHISRFDFRKLNTQQTLNF